jgi:hypothetical protein
MINFGIVFDGYGSFLFVGADLSFFWQSHMDIHSEFDDP